jgi:hypothetical protein
VGGNQGRDAAEAEAARHVQSIHHGEGFGCHLPGIGCLLITLLIIAVAAYFGADALNLHPAAYLTGLFNSILH